MKGFDAAQRAYDAMTPPEWDEWECQWCGAGDGDDHDSECPAYDDDNPAAEAPDYCNDCKTVGGCCCDEMYEEYKERQRGI